MNKIEVDKEYCMSSFLMYRFIIDKNKSFSTKIIPKRYDVAEKTYEISSVNDIDIAIRNEMKKSLDNKTGILLSSGIDSAILASYMPKGSIAYTLKTDARTSIDETDRAIEIAKICGLEHRVVEVSWEDYMKYSKLLMGKKGAPIHSIEPQLYKAGLEAKKDGLLKLVNGELADTVFGGLDGLLSKEWKIKDFIDRYIYVNPKKILKDYKIEKKYFFKHKRGDSIDVYDFLNDIFFLESGNAHLNALSAAGIENIMPYSKMKLKNKLDLNRIRSGESKYFLRELFKEKYPNLEIIEKIPLPRPVGEWLESWKGPSRKEFKENIDISELSGDQKWLVFILEMFLNLLDSGF